MNWKRGFGIGLMFFGTYLVIINGTINGNVIGFGDENIFGMFGFFIFFIGILFIFSGATLEERTELKSSSEIDVYLSKRTLGNKYFLLDTPRVFTINGEAISLEDFKMGIDDIKNDVELLGMAQKVYGLELMKIAEGEDMKKSFVAMRFLDALYQGNPPEIEISGRENEIVNRDSYEIVYDINPKLSLESQNIQGRLKKDVNHMENMLMKGGDPGIGSHSMGGELRKIYEARSAVSGGPRIYYVRDKQKKIITILGYSTKNNNDIAERILKRDYGR